MRTSIAAATVLLGWIGASWPQDAEACTCFGGVRALSPANGAVGVPINVEIKALVASESFEPALLDGEISVPIQVMRHGARSIKYVRIRPATSLKPGTEYTLKVGNEVTQFTTGDDVDAEPPTGGRIQRTEFHSSSGTFLGGESSCGSSAGYLVEVEQAQDDQTPASDVWFHVYTGDKRAEDLASTLPDTAIRSGPSFLGESLCNDTLELGSDRAVTITLVPVDYAGNEGAPGDGEQLASCGCASSGPGGLAPLILLTVFGASRACRCAVRLRGQSSISTL